MTEETKEKEVPKYIRAAVCFLIREAEALLAHKKKASFGQGFLMGPRMIFQTS